MNGQWVAWDDAKIHVLSHVAHYALERVRGHPLLRHAAAVPRSSGSTSTSTA